MKTNKKQLSAEEKFRNNLSKCMSEYYHKTISENVKKGLKLKRIRTFELKFGLDKHKTLPEDFIERVREYKEILREVEESTIEVTIDNFKRDLFPMRELKVWEAIAEYYSDIIKTIPEISLNEKKELFRKAVAYTLS